MNAPTDSAIAIPASLQLLAVELLRPSHNKLQDARRARFDKQGLEDLTANVRMHGILQPLLVRPHPRREAHYEIVAGERRWLAAKAAGLAQVPAIVHHVDDALSLELQLTENLQREGLHPMEEAEGYELLMREHHLDADAIAAKIGKSRSYVYARMKLSALEPGVRKLFYEGRFGSETALLLARIPVPALQVEASKHVTEGAMSFREAKDWIHREYMLRLGEAPWRLDDADLVPEAGACSACPKRAGNQPDLFPDVKNGNTCTDPRCFQGKREAWGARLKARAQEEGRDIISGKQAKEIMPYSYAGAALAKGYVRADDGLWVGNKHVSYRTVAGKDGPKPALLETKAGELIEVYRRADLKEQLKAQDVNAGDREAINSASASVRAAEQKRKREQAIRERIFQAIRATPYTLSRDDLEMIALAMWHRALHDGQKLACKVFGWAPIVYKDKYRGEVKDYTAAAEQALAGMDAEQLGRFLLDMAIVPELMTPSYDSGRKANALEALAARAGVDVEAIRSAARAEDRAKGKGKGKKRQPADSDASK